MKLVPASHIAMAISLLAHASPAAGQKSRIVFHTLRSLVTARLDPLVAPNGISSHSHHVVGGSNFNNVYNPDELRKSKCSNLGVHADKSAYWQPQVFQVLTNGSFIAMRTNTRIYYEQPNTKSGVKVEPFPYDFQMIAGDAKRQTFNSLSQPDIMQFYYCEIHNADGSIKSKFEGYKLPDKPCNIIVSKSFFPTCWNGKKYNKDDPQGHVRYPLFGGGYKGANCPAGFDRRLPNLLIETFYWRRKDLPAPAAGKQQFILANGDTTGYSLHADFANGWDMDVLTNMVNKCKNGPVEEPPEKACSFLAPSSDQGKGDKCQYQNKIPDEEVGYNYALKYLPGCNLPYGSGAKPTCKPREYKGNPKMIQPAASMVWP